MLFNSIVLSGLTDKILTKIKNLFNKNSFLNYDTYLKISKYLDSDSKIFWD